MVVTQKKEKKEVVISKAVDKHKIWLVAGIGLAILLVLVLVFYSSRKAVFGKVVEMQDSSQVLGRTDSLSDSLLAYYDFNSATEIGNELINDVDATCGILLNAEVPCPEAYDDPERGSVARFTGDLLSIQRADFLRLSEDYTIMFWIRAPNPSSGGTVLYGSGNTESESPLLIELTPVVSSPRFAIKVRRPGDSTPAVVVSRDIISQGEWVHVALVVDQYPTSTDQDNPFYWNVKLYVQGTEVDHTDGTAYNMDVSWGIIGARSGGTGSGFEDELWAWLDDIKIFTAALIPAEIREQGDVRELLCKNSYDDDVDGHVDCTDSDCDAREGSVLGNLCEYQQEGSCQDGFDNDADSQVDCNDNDCTATCAAYSLAQQRDAALAQIIVQQTQFNAQLGVAGERITAADRTRLRNSATVCANTARVGIQASTATSASISTALARGLACFNSPNAQLDSANSAAAGCSNQADDDGDAMVDCGDGDCGAVTVCQSTVDPLGTLRADAAAEIETRYVEVATMLPAAGEKMTTANRRAYNLDLEDVRRDGRAAVAAATTEAGITAAREEAFTNFIGFSSDIETDIRAAAGCSNGVDEDDPDLIVDCEDTDCSALALCVSGDSDIDGDGVMDTAEPAACRNTPATHGSVSANGCEEGDANQDGIINMDDAIAVARHVLGIADLPDLTSAHARCPRGAEVSMDDAIAIARFTLGIIDSLACT